MKISSFLLPLVVYLLCNEKKLLPETFRLLTCCFATHSLFLLIEWLCDDNIILSWQMWKHFCSYYEKHTTGNVQNYCFVRTSIVVTLLRLYPIEFSFIAKINNNKKRVPKICTFRLDAFSCYMNDTARCSNWNDNRRTRIRRKVREMEKNPITVWNEECGRYKDNAKCNKRASSNISQS